MSTITLALTATSVTAGAEPLRVTATVTNSATVPARVVLAAFAPEPGAGGVVDSAREWSAIDRPLREVPAGATEEFAITITPPPDAAAGERLVRFIAYDADRPPEEYSDRARTVTVVVPARAAAAPGTPWWLWVAAAALVLVVGGVAFAVLRPAPDPPIVPPSPSATQTVTPTPSPTPTVTPVPTFTRTRVLPTRFPTRLPTRATFFPTRLATGLITEAPLAQPEQP